MIRRMLVCLAVVLLTAGCVGASQDTIRALQTRVTELSEKQVQPTAEAVATRAPISSAFAGSAGTIAAVEDEDAFCDALAAALEENGWTVHDTYDDGLDVESPSGRLYMFQYSYIDEQVSRLILFSLWAGVGESNLSCETLTAVNEANDTYNLCKVSVDADGDVWLESIYPVGRALDTAEFLTYMEWYESAEDTMVLDILPDYLQ